MKKLLYTNQSNFNLPEYFPERIKEQSYIFQFESNEFIQKEEEEVHYLFYILEGKAKILKS